MNITSKVQIIILAKSIDGGTGRFFLDSIAIKNRPHFENTTTFSYYCLEKPKYRTNQEKEIQYLHKSSRHYPLKFSLSLQCICSYISDIYRIYKLIQKKNPALVFGIDAYCNILLLINKIILRRNMKVVCTTHINLSSTIKEKSTNSLASILRMMIHFFYSRADVLICVSKQVALDLKTYFHLEKDIKIIYYGHKPPDLTIRERKERKRVVFVSVGRLVPQKDFGTLINAFSLLTKKIKNSVLWIVGEGEERVKLKELVNQLGLRNKTLFLGWKQNIEAILKDADVFVLSSKREGFPYVLLEALSVGIPIISSNSPYGPAEILENGKYGVLVPVGDRKAMAEAMYEISFNQKTYKQYVQKSLERAKFFSLDKMLYQYAQVIQDAINRP